MIINSNYIRKISDKKYKFKTDNMVKLKSEDKAKIKDEAKLILEYKILSKI